MIVQNCISECNDGRERILDLSQRVVAVIHRTETGRNAFEISEQYRTNDAAGRITGYQMPYTFVISPEGVIEQALKLSDYGPHARAWNSKGVGIGVIGDFRRHGVPTAQYQSLVALCSCLAAWMDGAKSIYGHDELRDSMADSGKQCPGPKLDMRMLRADVKHELTGRLTDAGFVL